MRKREDDIAERMRKLSMVTETDRERGSRRESGMSAGFVPHVPHQHQPSQQVNYPHYETVRRQAPPPPPPLPPPLPPLTSVQQQALMLAALRPSSPTPSAAISAASITATIASDVSRPKKVGPAVPPKPKKPEPEYANQPNIYSNIPPFNHPHAFTSTSPPLPPETLPPPPPPPLPFLHRRIPPPMMLNMNYARTSVEQYPPPPSPVSSSYSELRRATRPDEFDPYSISSANSEASESIYEPIDPPSDMRARNVTRGCGSNYARLTHSNLNVNQEAMNSEVDTLSDILVKNLGSTQDISNTVISDVCSKCRKAIKDNCCTAMGKTYHVECFTCTHCSRQLQEEPFYVLNKKPYCSKDYENSLEKCAVCKKPIKDRILRATGRPYHKQCFCCVVCGQNLDGITFTVDASNQVYCIDDFHKSFAPRCSVCREPIMPKNDGSETIRIVALDRSFHVDCYKCEDCGLRLSSEAEGRGCYPLDDHVLCRNCNCLRIQELSSKIPAKSDY